VANRGQHAIVKALHIDAVDPVEIFFCRILQFANVRNTGIIDQDVDARFFEDRLQYHFYIGLACDVALMGVRLAPSLCYFSSYRCRLCLIGIENVDRSTILREGFRDCPANATGTAGNDGGLAVEPECIRPLMFQSETPLFQGMKSS
jgi:hypothetical protein